MIPPLRKRGNDILLLARAFLQRFAAENKKRIDSFTPKAIQAIERHNWPGNIRELENRIKRAVIMADGTKITPENLELDDPRYRGQSLKQAREDLEKDMVSRALARNKGHLTRTASELGISRPSLYNLMEKLGISNEKG